MVFKTSKSWGKTSSEWQKGKGKKGKDRNWSEPATDNSSWWGGDNWGEGQGNQTGPTGYARRLYARDFAPKKILRSYAASDGKVFYGEGTDVEMLEKESLRRWLTPETSELSRRPCWGMSMAGKSVAGMVGALGGLASASEKELAKLFSGKAGAAALAGLKDLEYDAHRHDPSALHKKFLHIFEFFKEERKKLHELLPQIAVNAAKLYLGATHALDLLVKANAIGTWAQQIPDEEHLQSSLDRFRSEKASPEGAARFLVGAYKARKKFEATWKRAAPGAMKGDDSDESPARPATPKKKKSSSSSTSAKKKKKTKKASKKRTKKSTSSPSERSRKSSKEKQNKKRKSSASPSRAAKKLRASAPKHWREVDEGQALAVNGKTHANCCLPLALARATLGPSAEEAAVHSWAATWVEALPREQQRACRVPANEAKLGEGLYDDYVEFERAQDSDIGKVILVVDVAQDKTRVWASDNADVDRMKLLALRHEGFHFTALVAEDGDNEAALKHLPAIEEHSYVGPPDLLPKLVELRAERP